MNIVPFGDCENLLWKVIMADLLDVMNKLRIKNKTIQEDLNQYKQNIAELKDQIVKDAKTNRKLQENRGLAEAAGGFNVRGKFPVESSWIDLLNEWKGRK